MYSKSSIYCHVNKPITGEKPLAKHKGGRPTKLSERDKRQLSQQVYKLRESEGTFTSRRVKVEAGLNHIASRTVRHHLNKLGFRYLQTRKKGRLSTLDLRKRLDFARKMVKDYDTDVWSKQISFYLDCKRFQHKTNPKDQARAPDSREWRKRNEGLKIGCTAKGQNIGSGSRTLHFVVAMSYDKGVIICERYERMNGAYFADFVKRNFDNMFQNSINQTSKIFLQDGDPSQNSKAARELITKCGATKHAIPARSPDVNPIENLFNLVCQKLKSQAQERNITYENVEMFSNRIMDCMMNFPAKEINKIIDTMNSRMKSIGKVFSKFETR